MNKTALFQDLDGLRIVKGLDEAAIDPEATFTVIQPELAASDEAARVKSCRLKIAAQGEELTRLRALAKTQAKEGDATAAASSTLNAEAVAAALQVLEDELAPLAAALDAKADELFITNAVYSAPAAGEVLVDDAQAAALAEKLAAIGAREALTLSGEIVPDFRGAVYWTKAAGKWTAGTVTAIGAAPPAGAILEADLSAAQRAEIAAQTETARIASLSAEAKAAELGERIVALRREAALKKTEAELDDEVFDAKAWYQAQRAALEEAYA